MTIPGDGGWTADSAIASPVARGPVVLLVYDGWMAWELRKKTATEKDIDDTSTAYHLLHAVKRYLILTENWNRSPPSLTLIQWVRKQSIITVLCNQTEISIPGKLYKSMTMQSSFTHHKLIYFTDKEGEHSSPSFLLFGTRSSNEINGNEIKNSSSYLSDSHHEARPPCALTNRWTTSCKQDPLYCPSQTR